MKYIPPVSPFASFSLYLKSDVAPKDLKAKGINGIDYYIKVLAEKPEWIAEAHQLGMKVNVWTVNDMEMVQKMNIARMW